MTQRPTQLRMYRPHLRDIPASPALPTGYEVRVCQGEEDELALADVLTASFGEDWPVTRVRSSLTEAPDVLAVYGASWRGAPVATASSRYDPEKFPDCGYVHWVGTHPDHARRGLGMALMARLLHDFQERGYRDAVLETDDFRLPAIRTYLRCGFLPVYEVDGDDLRDRWSAIVQAL